MSINERIRQRRIELGMSQKELANRLGYKTKSSIAKIENGYNDFPQNKIHKFAVALETSEGYLMGWDDTTPSKPDKISELFPQLTDENKDFVIKQIALLLAQQEGEE